MTLPDLQSITDIQIRDLDWYYTVELRPGVFTKGHKTTNQLATLALLDRIDVSGMRVLDVGTMEGKFSALAFRRGASVTSYDRVNWHDRIRLVQQAYECQFNYMPGRPFHEFVRQHHIASHELFDGIIFSGVLYHTISPSVFLYLVRTLLKVGGILIMETSALHDADPALFFNARGRFYPGTNFYQPTTAWLDYYSRLLGFRMIDVEYIDPRSPTPSGRTVQRVATTCILTDCSLIEPADEWGAKGMVDVELREIEPLRRAYCDGEARVKPDAYPDSSYYQSIPERTLDLTAAVAAKHRIVAKPEDCVLRLSDT
jgi:2-polyprenyl-3-methyl-5-hydroxy-6-metoxy-1,4-benzoquinol methylase